MSLLVVVVLTGLLVETAPAGVAAPAVSPAASPAVSPAARAQVLHRVVWDESRRDGPAIDLRSANPDGSDERRIYRRAKGFVLDLTLDRAGRRVALAPFAPRGAQAELVVVDVLTGEHHDVLADDERIDSVDGIGWSPDGRRLAFEGSFGDPEHRQRWLWTVGADGTGLRKVHRLELFSNEDYHPSNALAWTRRGILFVGHRGITLLRDGREQVVARGGRRLAISGNGRWLFVTLWRPAGTGASLWRMRPDGSRRDRVVAELGPNPRMGYLSGLAPDFAGRGLLMNASGPKDHYGAPYVVSHPATRGPRATDPVLDFLGGAYTFAWN
jgi:hypothetical protein